MSLSGPKKGRDGFSFKFSQRFRLGRLAQEFPRGSSCVQKGKIESLIGDSYPGKGVYGWRKQSKRGAAAKEQHSHNIPPVTFLKRGGGG